LEGSIEARLEIVDRLSRIMLHALSRGLDRSQISPDFERLDDISIRKTHFSSKVVGGLSKLRNSRSKS